MMKAAMKQHSLIMLLSFLTVFFTVVMVLLVVAPFILWQFMPFRELNIWAVDKTVPYPDYREHAGLFWVLKNERISKPGAKQLYSEKSDYFGFYPYGKNEWRGVSLPSSGPRPDIIYITDTYGVYKDDYMQKRLLGDLSPKIYGGLTNDDIKTIRKNLGGGNTFIAEFNTAASPTNLTDRLTLGRLLGVHWKGWIGNYFEDLTQGKEIPNWVVANYEAQNKKKWSYFGRGYVLISDEDQIEVLTAENDIGPAGMKFSFREPWATSLKLKKPVSYRYWFEWTEAEADIKTVADFRLDLTASGQAKLDALGLPSTFPAAFLYENPQYSGWYFAGDFADLSFTATPFRVLGISWLKRALVDDTVDSNIYFFWKAYVPLIRSILRGAEAVKKASAVLPGEGNEPKVTVRSFGKGFQMRDVDGIWKDFFVRGINMGLSEPGKYSPQFPQTVGTYTRWLDAISDMNANTIRIYTLPPPEFYKALHIHNTGKPDKKLYLLQGIWPEDATNHGDFLAKEYKENFLKEIDYGIDAVYGRANIPERAGRASGIYTADVSAWLLGWLVGRPLESQEVLDNDSHNKGASYIGRFVSAGSEAKPTEVWLAEALDEVASIESARYEALHPVALVSWPTLDPREHDSEWDPLTGKTNKSNDKASIDINHFEITSAMTAGLFGAYHIYPNYPDFINNEAAYGSYKDEIGMLRFGGYLKEFMEGHKRYPTLVAEFGLADGAGVAHYAPDGLNHGGNNETSVGNGILRMLAAIKKEGYAGGVVFEWMDEWVKKTWTTDTVMIPYDRHILWHNAVDPEQNYGLMANETTPSEKADVTYTGKGLVRSLSLTADASYLNATIELTRSPAFRSEEVLLGLDTLDQNLGQWRWPVGALPTNSGLEFVVRIRSEDSADLLVIPTYNMAKSLRSVADARHVATTVMKDGVFERMSILVNASVTTKGGIKIPARYFDASALREGAFDETGNLWRMEGNKIFLRIPWTLINVADPSSLTVLQDKRAGTFNPDREILQTAHTDGFLPDLIVWDRLSRKKAGSLDVDPENRYLWEGWEVTPPYRERLKKSYNILKESWAVEAAAEMQLRRQP